MSLRLASAIVVVLSLGCRAKEDEPRYYYFANSDHVGRALFSYCVSPPPVPTFATDVSLPLEHRAEWWYLCDTPAGSLHVSMTGAHIDGEPSACALRLGPDFIGSPFKWSVLDGMIDDPGTLQTLKAMLATTDLAGEMEVARDVHGVHYYLKQWNMGERVLFEVLIDACGHRDETADRNHQVGGRLKFR